MGSVSTETTLLLATSRMIRTFLLSCFLGLALAETQDYSLCYRGNNNVAATCMDVETDDVANTIHYMINETNDFEQVETLEDYNVGLAASRMVSQEACYVRRLVKSFASQAKYLKNHDKQSQATSEEPTKVTAILLENPEEEIGEDLTNFCGDLPVYKLVKKQEVEESDEDRRRQISVTFTRCVLLCYRPTCFYTTLTLPTGTTIIFGWWFFG